MTKTIYNIYNKNKEHLKGFYPDIIVFVLAGLAGLLLFGHEDIIHTAGSSFSLLKGHISDFYDYNAGLGIYDSYMPTTYYLYALWNLPLYITGIIKEASLDVPFFVTFWYKLLPSVTFAVSGTILYKICAISGVSEKKSVICAFLFICSPIGFFSQFIMCQYDIFTVFFMLLGLYYYMRNDTLKFIAFFAVSITLKYFSFAFYVPLLLLKEKKVLKIVRDLVFVLIPFAAMALLYVHSEVFINTVLKFSVLNYITGDIQNVINGVSKSKALAGSLNIPFNLLTAAVICFYAWLKKADEKTDILAYASFLCTSMSFAIFGFMFWHPQWLLIITPFIALNIIKSNHEKLFSFVSFCLMFACTVYISNKWYADIDQNLFNRGILSGLTAHQIGTKLMMKDIFVYQNADMLKIAVTALLFAEAVLSYPGLVLPVGNKNRSEKAKERSLVKCMRIRFIAGIMTFILPAFICFFVSQKAPFCTFNAGLLKGHLPGISNEFKFSQCFTLQTGKPSYVEFYAYDYDRKNTCTLIVDIVEEKTKKKLKTVTYDTSLFKNRQWLRIDLKDLNMKPWENYRIDFSSPDAGTDNAVTVYQAGETGKSPYYHAIMNGVVQDFDLSVKIFEEERPSIIVKDTMH